MQEERRKWKALISASRYYQKHAVVMSENSVDIEDLNAWKGLRRDGEIVLTTTTESEDTNRALPTSSADSMAIPVQKESPRQRPQFHRIDVHHHFIPECYSTGKPIPALLLPNTRLLHQPTDKPAAKTPPDGNSPPGVSTPPRPL
jgi:hypothetical protein